MLKQVAEEELAVVNKLLDSLSKQYREIIAEGGLFPHDFFTWRDYLNLKHRYLSEIVKLKKLEETNKTEKLLQLLSEG